MNPPPRRKLLQESMKGDLEYIENKLDEAKKRISLINNRNDIIIPEDKVFETDLKELHNIVTDVKTDLDARMEDYHDLIELIEEERKEDEE